MRRACSSPVLPRDAGARHGHFRAENLPDRNGSVWRSAWRQLDEGIAPTAWGRGTFRGDRWPADGPRGTGLLISDLRAVDHRADRGRHAVAEDRAAYSEYGEGRGGCRS